jgi:hypothetical protein
MRTRQQQPMNLIPGSDMAKECSTTAKRFVIGMYSDCQNAH